jgi:hypothetical protein
LRIHLATHLGVCRSQGAKPDHGRKDTQSLHRALPFSPNAHEGRKAESVARRPGVTTQADRKSFWLPAYPITECAAALSLFGARLAQRQQQVTGLLRLRPYFVRQKS